MARGSRSTLFLAMLCAYVGAACGDDSGNFDAAEPGDSAVLDSAAFDADTRDTSVVLDGGVDPQVEDGAQRDAQLDSHMGGSQDGSADASGDGTADALVDVPHDLGFDASADGGGADAVVDVPTDRDLDSAASDSASADGAVSDSAAGDGTVIDTSVSDSSVSDSSVSDSAADAGNLPGPDTCSDALPIVLNGAGQGQVAGTLSGLTADYAPSPVCGTSGGPDAVYYVDLPQGVWDVEIDTQGSVADTILSLAFACGAGLGTPACSDDVGAMDTSSRIWLHHVFVPPGATTRFYLVVHGATPSDASDYLLHVDRRPASSNSCASVAGDLPLNITGGGTVVGVQTRSIGSHRGSCMPLTATGGESIFLLESTSDVVDLAVYSTDSLEAVYMRQLRCTTGAEVACAAATNIGVLFAGLRQSVTPMDRHYVFVEVLGTFAAHYRPY